MYSQIAKFVINCVKCFMVTLLEVVELCLEKTSSGEYHSASLNKRFRNKLILLTYLCQKSDISRKLRYFFFSLIVSLFRRSTMRKFTATRHAILAS